MSTRSDLLEQLRDDALVIALEVASSTSLRAALPLYLHNRLGQLVDVWNELEPDSPIEVTH